MFDFIRDLDPTTTTLYLGALVPLIVGAITKKYTSPKVKALANIGTSAIVGSLAYLVTASGYNVGGFINHSAEAFLAGIGTYYGFLKPSGLAEKIQDKTSSFGVGEEVVPADEVVNVTPAPGYEIDDLSPHIHEDEDPLQFVGEPADAPRESGRMP